MEFRAKIVSWDDIERWCTALREKIKGEYHPDTIIGLSRGGLVPARILSDSLLIKDLYAVKTEHWGITATMDGKTVLKDTGKLDISGKKVIVVDDITDTGESMKVATAFLAGMNPKEIRTATMLHITHSNVVPDYYAEKVDSKEWTWFTFPWNVYEDLYNLSSKVLERKMTTEEIEGEFRERFDLRIDHDLLESRLSHLKDIGRIAVNGGRWYLPES